jgi:predicted metal-dependent hydrolase
MMAGTPFEFRVRRSPRARRVRVSVDGAGEVEVGLPKRAPERAAAQAVRELTPWIERRRRTLARAAAEIAPRLDAATARAGTRYTGLTIRGQKTRWASCSTSGHMSFNWRLLLAPEPVVDYVVEHEVCHLEVLDHSPRFWARLEARVPDWRDHARWLRRYGATLRL